MEEEDSLVPYRTTDLKGRRILVLAAHPDDEALGPGGTVALAAPEAEAVRTWIATDGEQQEGAAAEEAAAYAERRREESRRAAERLGLPRPVFAGLPDRELSGRRLELDRLLERELVDFRPDLVFCPSPVEIHPDHRALAEALFDRVGSSRSGDRDHEVLRLVRIAFYEISHPLLPNALVDIGAVRGRKDAALAAYESQQAVRDYAAALGGLNAYRRLTLGGEGPVEAFRVLSQPEASTRSYEEFRGSIGPSLPRVASRSPAPVAIVVRTRNRPALLREALASLAEQTLRPARVVVVNDGGAGVGSIVEEFRSAFDVLLDERPERSGRSVAANRGVAAAGRDLVGFLDDDDRLYPDHLERLMAAHGAGPESVVYSDSATVVYRRDGEQWKEAVRALEYSLDFDPEYLLLANYIPLHTLLLPAALYSRVGGFDEGMDYSEDWDFLIRLSFETAFRHVRAITCEYRVFDPVDGDPGHAGAGSAPFQRARQAIYEKYRNRRTEEGLARTLDRLRAQIARSYERDGASRRELLRLSELEARNARLQADRDRIFADAEAAQARIGDLQKARQEYHRHLSEAYVEIDRIHSTLNQIYESRTWKLHLFLDRLRGRH